MQEEQLAQSLGWFSLGLGLAEVIAPGQLANFIGVRDTDDSRAVLRLCGLREIVSGLDILSHARPLGGVRSRVAGDAMDLALLGMALNSKQNDRNKVMLATAAVVGVTALDLLGSKKLSDRPDAKAGNGRKDQKMEVKQAVTINRSVEELYQFWHDFENLPQFMVHLESVKLLGDRRSHWKAKAPAGATVEWDAEVTDDQPNKRIAWQSLEGADIKNSGSVSFETSAGNRGTIVRVVMEYSPPGGAVGAGIAKLFGEEPEKQVWEDLHRLKQVMEIGEILLSDGSPEGMGSSTQRPAQQTGAAAPA